MDLTTTFGSALAHSISPRHRRPLAMALTALALIGLLIAFVQVLKGSVAQGDQRRRDEADQAEATWRCKALRGPTARTTCLAQVPTPGSAR
jgi:hypothetical protein